MFKTTYLNGEVNCIEPSPSVSVPWSTVFSTTVIYNHKTVMRLATGLAPVSKTSLRFL